MTDADRFMWARQMRPMKFVWVALLASGLFGSTAQAGTISNCVTPAGAISCAGIMDSPEDVFTQTFALSSASTITIQTYGFGGGTNAAGTTLPAGGFDSLVALFSGTATAATVLESSGNPIASADNLSLYSPGCPPAGLFTVGTVPGVCGDNTLLASLSVGTYTLLLTDANFVALSVNPNVLLGPYDLTDTSSSNYGSSTGNGAYTDLSGGVFQTCVSLTDCNTDNGNFAVDITGLPTPAATPEPGAFGLAGLGLLFAAWLALAKKSIRK